MGRARLTLGLLTAGVLLAAWPGVAGAAIIPVTTTADDYDATAINGCSLREAVDEVNNPATSDRGCAPADALVPDTIQLASGATYVRTRTGAEEPLNVSGDLNVTEQVTIQSAAGAVIQGTGAPDGGRVFHTTAPLDLFRVTIRSGNAGAGAGGGILVAPDGPLDVEDSTIMGNTATSGGGIDTQVATSLKNVTVSGNTATGNGGGVAIETADGLLGTNNATVSNNTAGTPTTVGDGGGIHVGGGGAEANITNTIVSGNLDQNPTTDCPDFFGELNSNGYNLIGTEGICLFGEETGDLVGANPMLAPLGDYGGPTQTMGLLAGSAAHEAGNPTTPGLSQFSCEVTDQRGVARPVGARCDIGAFEGTATLPASGGDPGNPKSPKKCKKTKKKKKKSGAATAKKKKKRCKRKKRK